VTFWQQFSGPGVLVLDTGVLVVVVLAGVLVGPVIVVGGFSVVPGDGKSPPA
jgi:hypothetical protein